MGFSSSRSSTHTTTTTANNGNYGASAINITGLSTGKRGQININTSDYGAVQGGLGLAAQSLAFGRANFESAIGAVQSNATNVIAKTLDIANKNQVSESAQMQDTIVKLVLVGGAVFALYAWAKKG